MDINELRSEFKSISKSAVHLSFLSDYLPADDKIFVQPFTGFVTSEKRMTTDDVVSYWSHKIFPDKSIESYSAHFPFAQSRLLYVIETIAQFSGLDKRSNLTWGDYATGEGVLLDLLSMRFPNLHVTATEHSKELVENLQGKGFNVSQRSLGNTRNDSSFGQVDIATLTWTLANSIDPFAVLSDVVSSTNEGGLVCVAESSRVLVPFRKSLRDYFSKTMPADLHPSNFSANTLRCLMQICGLEICYVNRYFDSDVLLVIGKKVSHKIEPSFVDNQTNVVEFFKEWHRQTRYFESLRGN